MLNIIWQIPRNSKTIRRRRLEEAIQIAQINSYFETLWKGLQKNPDCRPFDDLRTFQPQKDTTYQEILKNGFVYIIHIERVYSIIFIFLEK